MSQPWTLEVDPTFRFDRREDAVAATAPIPAGLILGRVVPRQRALLYAW